MIYHQRALIEVKRLRLHHLTTSERNLDLTAEEPVVGYVKTTNAPNLVGFRR